MFTLSTILFALTLLGICISDFKYRLIPVYMLLAVWVLAGMRIYYSDNPAALLHSTLVNVLGTITILGFSFLVLFLLKRKLFNPFNKVIGTGDLLFFPVLCATMSPVNYILFFIASGLIIIIFRTIVKQRPEHIPLAGVQAMFLLFLLGLTGFTEYTIVDDTLILQLIS